MRKTIKKVSEDDQPVGQLTKISSFLPPPEKLVPVRDTVKVTIAIDRESLNFFKSRAEKLGTKYQKMIREVIRGYASRWA